MLYLAPRTGLVVQGAYDAEAHQVTVGQLDAFFTAYATEGYPNRLADGEGLAIGFPAGPVETYTAPYPKGGRRQSIFDLPTSRLSAPANNTTPVSGYSLFNTGYEPEKIPGAVPIGKLVRILLAPGVYATEFVFIDGTRVRLGADPVALGESGAMLTRLASRTGVTGASLIGYGGSDAWNPTVTGSPTTLPAGTIEEALDAVVTQLGGQGAGIGGARRVGFEQVTGASSPGNAPLNLTGSDTSTGTNVKSVQIALSKALNEPSTVLNPGGGVNYRVSERGHRMHGPNPIEKIFSESDTVGGGAQLVRAVLNEAPNARIGGQIEEQALALLKPFVWKNYGDTLAVPSSFVAQAGVATNEVKFPEMTAAQATVLQRNLALHSDLAQKAHCIVRLDGTTVGLDGYYFAGKMDDAAPQPTLNIYNLSNGSPDLSTIAANTTLTFFQSSLYGNDGEGNMARHTVGRNFSGAAAAYFGQGRIKQGYDEAGVLRHSETVLGAVWYDYASAGTVNNGTGATTSAGATAGNGLLRVTGLTGMSASSEGRLLLISSASNTSLLGRWRIVTYVAADEVWIQTPYTSLTAVTGIIWFELVDGARRTDNILIKEDANLLRGVEYGVAVDATVNHHHNTAYSFVEVSPLISVGARLDFLPGTNPTVTMDALSTTGAYLDAAWVSSFVPTGYAPVGVFLECSLDLRLIPGGLPRDAWDLLIKTSPGTTWAPGDSRVLFQETGYKQLTVGNQDVLKRVVCAFVRTNASGEAAFQADIFSSILEHGMSTLQVRPTAILCARQ
jgi:hypothetical protein